MAAEEAESLIESNFRRLLVTIEDERERLRNGVKQLADQKEKTKVVCEEMKGECEKWCFEERQKIAKAWEEVKEVHKQIGLLNPADEKVIKINCAGTNFETTKGTLTVVQGSYLNNMFSPEFEGKLQKDGEGRYLLDFNPVCFGLILDWLRNKKQSNSGTVPLSPVPPEQRGNMDILCESLRLGQFVPTNVLQTVHQTSLKVGPTTVESTHDGWQVIVAQYPLRMSRKTYFEAKIASNADPRGGLAVGVMGHVPTGLEIHSLKQKDGLLYNSNNGLIQTPSCGMADILKQIMFKEGSAVGCEFDPGQHLVRWYFNGQLIGSCAFKADVVDQIQTVYPCFALFARGQKLEVDFKARPPMGSETAKQPPE